jgi:putative transposase
VKFDPQKHHRRSIRLKHFDYSQDGAYYVTIDIQNRECCLGEIVDYEMILNEAGKMIEEQWIALIQRFPNIELDLYQVMPNHFHGIIVIVGAAFMAAQSLAVAQEDKPILGDIVGAFKSITTH